MILQKFRCDKKSTFKCFILWLEVLSFFFLVDVQGHGKQLIRALKQQQ